MATTQNSSSKLCPELKAPIYGKFKTHCFGKIGDKCEVICEKKFELVGSKIRLCLPNGQWSGLNAKCISKLLVYVLSKKKKDINAWF